MIDVSYFDEYIPNPTDKGQVDTETKFLIDLASNVGNYMYEYKDENKGEPGANDKLNLGIMAQQLQKVPGLDASVITNEDGSLAVDGARLALTTLGYVATLAKLLLQMRGIDYDRPNQTVVTDVQNGGGANTEDTTGSGANSNIESGTVTDGQQTGDATGVLPDETATDTTDVYAAATNANA